jgi:hypothetical protein
MHQLLRYASGPHVEIELLPEKNPVTSISHEKPYHLPIEHAINIWLAPVFAISGGTSIPGVLYPAFRLPELRDSGK